METLFYLYGLVYAFSSLETIIDAFNSNAETESDKREQIKEMIQEHQTSMNSDTHTAIKYVESLWKNLFKSIAFYGIIWMCIGAFTKFRPLFTILLFMTFCAMPLLRLGVKPKYGRYSVMFVMAVDTLVSLLIVCKYFNICYHF